MPALVWLEPVDPPRGVALVVHGLNQRPECMGPVIDLLTAQGIGCVGLALRGHGDNYVPIPGVGPDAARMASFRRVHAGLWLGEARAGYALARTRSERDGVPLYLAAYSLGGLAVCDLMTRDATVRFDRMLLLAPALAIRPWTRVLRLLAHHPDLVIRSFTPSIYRANQRGTPMAAYNALFALADHFATHASALLNVPTLVFVDPEDELVAAVGLTALVAAKGWRQWRVEPIYKTSPALGQYHHLLTGPDAVGAPTWARMARMTAEHFMTK